MMDGTPLMSAWERDQSPSKVVLTDPGGLRMGMCAERGTFR